MGKGRVVQQDPDGFERFCVEAHPKLVAALSHLVGDLGMAEELAQEALIRAGVRWAHVSGLDAPIGWAFRVGANLGTSQFRRRQAERRALQRLGGDRPRDTTDVAEVLSVRAALASLTRQQREAVVLRYYLGLTAAEAAEALGTRPDAVRSLTYRAVTRLRSVLDIQVEEAADAP